MVVERCDNGSDGVRADTRPRGVMDENLGVGARVYCVKTGQDRGCAGGASGGGGDGWQLVEVIGMQDHEDVIDLWMGAKRLNRDVDHALWTDLLPLFGQGAKWFMGIGLMAAGISSALTAPLAAAYAAKGLFAWSDDETDIKFRAVWMIILLIGVLVSITDVERVLIIQFAQITNAILLPFIAVYLLFISNSKKLLGQFTNGLLSNVLGGVVIIVTILLSFKSLNSIFSFI